MPKARKSPGTALITGAAKRIGREIAVVLGNLGYTLAIHYNNSQAEAEQLAIQLKKNKIRCDTFQANLGDEEQTIPLIPEVLKKFSNLNLLINCASIFEPSKFDVKDLALYKRHFDINLKAPFILSSQFYHLCKKGQIINLLDTDIVKNKTSHVAYLLTKKALAEMTKLSAVKFAPHIRVNGIAPGLILPPKNENMAYLDRRAQAIPLKRRGHPRYIAQSVQFLIEHEFLTGQFLFNDGGEHLV